MRAIVQYYNKKGEIELISEYEDITYNDLINLIRRTVKLNNEDKECIEIHSYKVIIEANRKI